MGYWSVEHLILAPTGLHGLGYAHLACTRPIEPKVINVIVSHPATTELSVLIDGDAHG